MNIANETIRHNVNASRVLFPALRDTSYNRRFDGEGLVDEVLGGVSRTHRWEQPVWGIIQGHSDHLRYLKTR